MAYQDIGLRVVLQGVGEFRRGVAVVRSDLSGLADDLRVPGTASAALSTKLSVLGDQMINLGRTMTLGLTIPIVGLGTALFNAGIEFEDAFADVLKTTEGTTIGFKELAVQLYGTATGLSDAQKEAVFANENFGKLTKTGEELRQQFLDMSLEIPISASELARLGGIAGQLGVPTAQIEEFTRTVAMLGTATNLSAEDAADAIARFANIMDISSKDLATFALSAGSAIVDLGNKSAASESEIINLVYRISGAGNAIGLTSQEIIALSTSIAELGVRAESGGSAVSRILLEMQSAATGTADSAQATQALASATAEVDRQLSRLRASVAGGTTDVNTLRLQFMDTDLELGNMSLLLSGVENGTISLDKAMSEIRKNTVEKLNKDFDVSASKLELFAQAAGVSVAQFKNLVKNSPVDAFYKVSAGLAKMQEEGTLSSETLVELGLNSIRLRDVINRFGPDMGNLTQNIKWANAAWNEQIALEEEARKKYETVKSQLALLRNAFNVLGTTLFDLYSGVLVDLISGLKNILLGINDLSKSSLRWIVQIGGIAAAMGPLLIALGTLSKISSIVVASMGKGLAVLTAINPLFVLAAAAVVAFGYAYSKNLGGIQDKTKAVIKEIKNIGYWLGKAFDFGVSIKGNIFGGIAASFKALTYIYEDNKTTFFSNVLEAFGLGEEKAQEFGMIIRNVLAPALLFISDGFNFLADLFNSISQWTQIIVTDFLRFTGVLDILRNAFLAFLSGDFDFAFESLKLAWEHIVTWYNFEGKALIMQALADIVTIIISFIQTNIMPIVNKLSEWGQAFVQWVIDVAPGVIDTLGKLIGDVLTWIGNQLVDIDAKLLDWATAFVKWVDEADLIPKLAAFLIDLQGWIGEKTLVLVDKLLEWAGAFVEWLGPATEKILPKLGTYLGTVISWILFDAVPQLIGAIATITWNFIKWASDAATKIGPKLWEFLMTVLNYITFTLIPSIFDAMISFGKAFIDGMKEGISDNWDAFVKWFTDKVGSIPIIGKAILEIGSPSKVFADQGKNIVLGLQEGINQSWPSLIDSLGSQLTGLLSVASSPMPLPASTVSGNGSSVVNNSSTRVFAPNVSGVPIAGQESMINDLDRMYRLATMAGV